MPIDYEALRERRLAQLEPELQRAYAGMGEGFNIAEMGVERFRALLNPMMGDAAHASTGVTARTIDIPGPAGDVPTRLYVPDGVDGPLGVYVHTHGGGWIAGDGLDWPDGYNSQRATEWGCAVVHPDFRVAPEHPFPAAIDDCWAVVQWVAGHATELGLDDGRIAVGGGCTGANIAAVMALMARDAGTPKLALQYLWAPQLDARCDYRSQFEFATGYGLSRDDDVFVMSQYLQDPNDRWDWRVSPVLADSVADVAPALISVGEFEILRDEARLYAGRLRDAGVEVHYFEAPGGFHGHQYARNPQTGAFLRIAHETQQLVNPIVRGAIGPESTRR